MRRRRGNGDASSFFWMFQKERRIRSGQRREEKVEYHCMFWHGLKHAGATTNHDYPPFPLLMAAVFL